MQSCNLIPDRWLDWKPPSDCHDFGIGELLAAGLIEGGIGAETAGAVAPAAVGALEGAGVGSALSGVTGGDPLTGAFTGALTGGATGGAGGLGLGAAGEAVAGAGAGAAGAVATGQDPLTAAVGGAGSGLIGGAMGGSGGGTAGAGGSAAGTGVSAAGAVPVDLTSAGADFGGGGVSGTGSAGVNAMGLSTPASGVTDVYGGKYWGGTSGGTDFASKAMGFIEKNPGVLLGGGILGIQALMGNQALPAEKSLERGAAEAQSMGKTLSSYLFSGTLPAGAQQAIDSATNAAKARVRSSYAQMGLAGSTMEGQALQQIDQSAAAQVFQMADQLLKQGADYSKLADDLYGQILKVQLAEDQAFAASLGKFAGGLAGAKFNTASA